MSVDGGVLDVPVPEVMLDGARVLAVIGEFEAGRVAEHVGMDWHAQPSRVASASDEVAAVIGAWRSETKT